VKVALTLPLGAYRLSLTAEWDAIGNADGAWFNSFASVTDC